MEMPQPGTYYNGHYVPLDPEWEADQAAHPDPWATTIRYGYYGTYFFAATIVIAVSMNLHAKYVQRRRLLMTGASDQGSPFQSMLYAMCRWSVYSRLPWSVDKWIAPIYTTGSLAQTLLLAAGFLFCTGYCFGITYYYRRPFYGSSPLGLRSEWLAMAMLPFLFVLAQKRNLIGTMTGTPYQKLQVLHQGVSGLHFYMSIVHTVSMSIRGMREMGVTEGSYITGWAALAPLIWLCVASLPVFRSKAYEAFWMLHLAAVITYLVTLWYHVVDELDSNAYMYATFAVFSWGAALRLGYLLYHNLTAHRAYLALGPTGAILVTIPTRIRWAPGQHVLLHFLSVRPLESHPFSLASLPTADGNSAMSLVVRPHTGFSAELAASVQRAGGSQTLGVLVDGPFGEAEHEFRAYDAALLIAGGSGIAHVLSIFLDLVRCRRGEGEGAGRTRCAKVELLWGVHCLETLQWFEKTIVEACAGLSEDQVLVRVFVTGDAAERADSVDGKNGLPIEILDGRVDIEKLVWSRAREWGGRVAVAACGPGSFATDCSNAVAGAQLDIVQGKTACEEMYLQLEMYSW